MKHFWENGGKPFDDGEHKGQLAVTIDMEDGTPVNRYYGNSERELTDRLLEAQAHASQTIREQKRKIADLTPVDPARPKPQLKPRALTADERFRVAQDINDPAKAPEAIATVVEAAIGAPLKDIASGMQSDQEKADFEFGYREGRAFIAETPEYYNSEHNNRVLDQYIRLHQMAPSRNNLRKAFVELQSNGLLQSRPSSEPAPASGARSAEDNGERTANSEGQRRPRLASTGLRNSDTHGSAPARTAAARQGEYTLADIENMPTDTYAHKLKNEPGFAEKVDRIYDEAKKSAGGRR